MHTFIVRPKDYEPSTIKMDKTRLTIGRSSRNDICLSDPFASRLHAELRRENEQMLLVDNGSANGTYLNGQKVSGALRIRVGDIVRIGETEIEYAAGEQSAISGATVYLSDLSGNLPADTITTRMAARSTSELISSIQSGSIAGEVRSSTGVKTMLAPQSPGRDLLSIVSQVGIALLPRTSLEDTLKMTIDLILQATDAERGFLFLKEGNELNCKIARGATLDDGGQSPSQIQISRSITNKVLEEGVPILTSDAMHDPRFQAQQSVVLSNIRSVMAVPLASGEETFGMVYVDNPFHNRFKEEDLKVLTTIASVASIKIEHERLLEERLEKRRMEEELKVASEIQMRLQPVSPPKLAGWDMTAVSFPCREIGGDYYDYIPRRDGKLALAVGDVSGKGTGAALLMSSVHAAVRAQAQTNASISEVMCEINCYIYENSPSNKYLTLFYSVLEPTTGELTYSNGGHNTPLLMRANGEMVKLDKGGLPVGLMPEITYDEDKVQFQAGDVLVIYSDGITESVNLEDEEFGEERLIEVVKNHLHRSASGIRDRIDEALARFVGTAATVDDMTVMIVKRTA
ncbi:MAG: SpoIIE family protein phosphatase [Acidobacteria bacterium]|nr:SpoIIE family protein phosphatase [Acidobacteriota bacterium]